MKKKKYIYIYQKEIKNIFRKYIIYPFFKQFNHLNNNITYAYFFIDINLLKR